jgi:hypothetical protein
MKGRGFLYRAFLHSSTMPDAREAQRAKRPSDLPASLLSDLLDEASKAYQVFRIDSICQRDSGNLLNRLNLINHY